MLNFDWDAYLIALPFLSNIIVVTIDDLFGGVIGFPVVMSIGPVMI